MCEFCYKPKRKNNMKYHKKCLNYINETIKINNFFINHKDLIEKLDKCLGIN